MTEVSVGAPRERAFTSWQDLVSKIHHARAGLPPDVVDDGPDPTAAAACWRLVTAPDMSAHIDKCDVYLGKHGQQIESLCRQIAARGPFAHIVEFGAGKGLLGRVLQELMPGAKLTTVEINDAGAGFDRADTRRIVQDVHETESVRQLFNGLCSSGRVCVLAKHLCGSATDALLQALLPVSVDCVFIAPCCHSKIEGVQAYCNPGFLAGHGVSTAEWPMMIKLLAYARQPVDTDKVTSSELASFGSWRRWEQHFGGRKALIGLGRTVRFLIESGRASFLRGGGFSNAHVVEYAPRTATSENMLIIADRNSEVVPVSIQLPKIGVLLCAASGALRTTQFLMEMRGGIVEQGGGLPWLSIFACNDDVVAVLGRDVREILYALKSKASLLIGLRVVDCMYPFDNSSHALADVLMPPAGVEGPYRLAVTPRTLLPEVLELADSEGLELSPQRFVSSISVCRLWDGSFGVACLPRIAWHPGEEPRNWETELASSVAGGPAQRSIHRLQEWHVRLGIRLRDTKVALCVNDADTWRTVWLAVGGEVVEAHEAEIYVLDRGQNVDEGLAGFAKSSASTAIAIAPFAVGNRGGKAARAGQMVAGLKKVTAGMRMSVHHFLSNRDRERTVVLHKSEDRLGEPLDWMPSA